MHAISNLFRRITLTHVLGVLVLALFAAAILLLMVTTGHAQDTTAVADTLVADSTIVVAPGTLPDAAQITGWLYVALLTIALPWIVAKLEHMVPMLRGQGPQVKRVLVLIVPGVITFALAWLKTRWPALPLDPEYWQALVGGVGALAAKAGDTAKEAKASTDARGD